MLNDATLIVPQFGALYEGLSPAVTALLRVLVALLLVPHGLRFAFGMFPNSGARVLSLKGLAVVMEKSGYRPAMFWVCVTIFVQFVAAPLMALGLFTRPAALLCFVFLAGSTVAHIRDGWFWNTQGVEYPLLWTGGALFFAVHGGGAWSLDALLGWQF